MANNTISQYKFKNFGNYDLSNVMDLTDVENLDIPFQNTEVTFVATGASDVNVSVKPKVPDSVTFKILGYKLKQENRKMYDALSTPTKDRSLGSCIMSNGTQTQIFSKVLVEKGLDFKGSYEMHTTISLKFIK
jgi:hypothetical protein